LVGASVAGDEFLGRNGTFVGEGGPARLEDTVASRLEIAMKTLAGWEMPRGEV